MSSFLSRMQYNDVQGENGMPAHSSSSSALVDMFFHLGTRTLNAQALQNFFTKAFYEDPVKAFKILFYNRDPRGGRGERESFRTLLKYLGNTEPEKVKKVVHLIPEYGRWDDLFSLIGTGCEEAAFEVIYAGLESRDRLCAKWMPRKGKEARKLREFLGLTPKSYRKALVERTQVVESLMCANQWEGIDFSKVPSRAGMIYAKAFFKHQAERYAKWREDLKKPESKAKINVGALYPHEILHKIQTEGREFPCEEAWKRLGELFPAHNSNILPVCDVSGSMYGLPMEVSVALGIFLSERNTGKFKDVFCTFSERPQLQLLRGDLLQKVRQLSNAAWGMNTNLEAVFKLIVTAAQGAAKEDVPTHILILSDMQFDQCVKEPRNNALEMIEREFGELGLERPKVIFWNLRDVGGDVPVKHDAKGTALVSGFSPSVLKTIVTAPDDFTPLSIMEHTIGVERYKRVEEALR